MSPTILSDIFTSIATPYNRHNKLVFKMQKAHSLYNDTEVYWRLVPQEKDSLCYLVCATSSF